MKGLQLDTSLISHQFKIKISDWLIKGKNSKYRLLWMAVGNRTMSKWTNILSIIARYIKIIKSVYRFFDFFCNNRLFNFNVFPFYRFFWYQFFFQYCVSSDWTVGSRWCYSSSLIIVFLYVIFIAFGNFRRHSAGFADRCSHTTRHIRSVTGRCETPIGARSSSAIYGFLWVRAPVVSNM